MGREIVYCWKCATRLSGDDFERGKAFRHGDKVACAECVFELVADLPAEEQEAILHPPKKRPSSAKVRAVPEGGGATTQMRRSAPAPRTRTGMTGKIPMTPPAAGTRSISKKITRPIPKAEPPPEEEEPLEGEEDPAKKKKKILLIAGGMGGLLVIVAVVLIVALNGGKKPSVVETSEDSGGRPKIGAKKPDTKPESPADLKARSIFQAVMKLKADNPNDLAFQWKSWQEAAGACKGTAYEGKPEAEIELLKARLEKEVADLQKQCEKMMENEEFKKIFDLWEANKDRYDLEDWKNASATKAQQYKGIMNDRLKSAKKEILAALDEENAQKKLDVIKRISTWGFPDLVAELDNLKPGSEAPDPNPANPDSKLPVARAMSPEMKAFMPTWQSAVLPAYGRDYAAAVDALTKAAKDAEAAEVKKAAADDAADLQKATKIIEEGKKLATALKRLETLEIEYQAAASDWKKITGKVLNVDALRIELATDIKEKPRMFIEISDLATSTLAELYIGRSAQKAPEDPKLAAILCLLEGHVEAAKKVAGSQINRVPDRFWQFAPEIKDKAPKPSSREFEARDLYLKAELEFGDKKTWAAAFEKYKLLLGEYSQTEYVRRTQAVMTARMERAKEYVFAPNELKTPGTMNTFKAAVKPKGGAELAIITTKELEFNACQENYVQIEFYALPNTNYRCWALIGGCCAETMTFYYQTTEGKIKEGGKEKSIEPGGRAIDTLIPPLPSLPKEHAKHKDPKSKTLPPKEPTRWDWVEIKLPKPYAAPGAKEIRVFTEQPGFGIAYVLISSTRTTAPDAKVKADLDKEYAGGGAPAGPTVKSSPEPTEWLFIGPFGDKFETAHPPESEIDLGKKYAGKKGDVKWEMSKPSYKNSTVLFEWDKTVTPKDNVAVYTLIYVKAPSAMDAQLWLGHDDGCRVWQGTNLIHNLDKAGSLKGDEHKEKIKLDLGWNRFLFKVYNKKDAWGLAVRWVDGSGKPLEGLEFSTDVDHIEKK